jgi:sulfide:quinone oxidoreductase
LLDGLGHIDGDGETDAHIPAAARENGGVHAHRLAADVEQRSTRIAGIDGGIGLDEIFVIGDATNIPASKAGSVSHFEAEILTENIKRYVAGQELKAEFDGHANCFIETGNGKALLIDFNYTHEPVEGTFPFPGIGPLRLLKESRMNHMGKLAFRWIYWNMLLKGTHIPFVSTKMSTKGKKYADEKSNA